LGLPNPGLFVQTRVSGFENAKPEFWATQADYVSGTSNLIDESH